MLGVHPVRRCLPAGKVEELDSDVVAPQSVDVIVSEWMGYMGGLFETMCVAVAPEPQAAPVARSQAADEAAASPRQHADPV